MVQRLRMTSPVSDNISETSTALYATVAVDEPVDAEYTYRIPPDMRHEVHRGSRVMVPLGGGNRLTAATILSLSADPPQFITKRKPAPLARSATEEAMLFETAEMPFRQSPSNGPAGLKPIHDVMRNVPPVPADLLDLARWISNYYCCPIGLVLAGMVPAAVKRAVRTPTNAMVSLAHPGQSVEESTATVKLSPRARKAFAAVHAALASGEQTELQVMAAARITRSMMRKFIDLQLVIPRKQLQMPLITGAEATGNGPPALTLGADQQRAMNDISALLARGGFAVRLIYGVTGSGKTELYIRAIEQVVAQGKRAIVLVPEISLTPQTVKRFMLRFQRVAVLHSGLKESERHQHWRAIAEGWAQVVVGARSAIFAPAADIGLIVVDEEHDHSYKQDSAPKYHGRDVAIRRAQMLGIPVLLGSATPALESWHNAHGGNPHWGLLTLKSRPLGTQMPRVVVVDMKQQSHERRGLHILSTVLEHHLKQTLEKGKQAIFLLNRRGYAHYIMCPRCQWVFMCENCDATMVVHRSAETAKDASGSHGDFAQRYGQVKCHYCLTSMMLPARCPSCQAKLTHLGQGTQRAEDELARKFPTMRIARMDSDTMGKVEDYQETLDAFGLGEIDLLVGTQMIAKGLDFPNVQLVGVLNSDLAMSMPDFRAAERTFQLICQVAGRSGRSVGGGAGGGAGSTGERGTVVVQTFQPQEPAILHACNHDYLGFVASELPHRKECGFPPYGRIVRILMAHKGYTKLHTEAQRIRTVVDDCIARLKAPVKVVGPVPPPMERLQEEYRVEMLLIAETAAPLQQLLRSLRTSGVLHSGTISLSVDVDPMSML